MWFMQESKCQDLPPRKQYTSWPQMNVFFAALKGFFVSSSEVQRCCYRFLQLCCARCTLTGRPHYATADALSFTATNEYPIVEHSRWPLVTEPFRSTTFTASSTAGQTDKDVFQWSFPDGTVLEGR